MRFHSNADYQKLIEELDEIVLRSSEDDKILLMKNKQLEEIAEEQQDMLLKTIALYHKGDIPYHNSDFPTARAYIEESLHLAQEINFSFYIMRCYNSLAAIDSQTTDYYSSISNYLKAFQIADRYPEFQFGCYILNNIGNLFVWLDEHQAAIDYLLLSYGKYMEEGIHSITGQSIIILNIIEEYSLLHEYEKANEWAAKQIPFIDEAQALIDNILAANKIDEYYQGNQISKIPALVHKVIAHSDEDENFIYAFRCYLRILAYAIRESDYETAAKIFERTELMHENTGVKTFEYDYAVIKVEYYHTFQEAQDDGSLAKQLLCEYTDNSTNIVKQMKNTYTRRLIIEAELMKLTNEKEDAELKSRQLQKDIELDYFTKILNKMSLEKYINLEISSQQTIQGTKQALIILDIDRFKHVNDTYGHKRGDELILQVVDTISSCCSKTMLFGRFGGDEFVLFLKDIRYIEFVKNFAKELLERARQIQVDDNLFITLSLGIYILQAYDDFKQAFQKADQALYEAKRRGRNGYYLYEESTS